MTTRSGRCGVRVRGGRRHADDTLVGASDGRNNANCYGCGGRWDRKQTAAVGSFGPDPYELSDMLGPMHGDEPMTAGTRATSGRPGTAVHGKPERATFGFSVEAVG